jgi:ketosteroid isomerase-like protein
MACLEGGGEVNSATETVRAMYAAFARGDVPAVLELLDPDVAWVTPTTLPWSRGTYSGRDGVAEYFNSFAEALEEAAVEPHELLTCGNRVVALGEERARVRATGDRFRAPFAHVIRVHEGRVRELRGHVDTATIRAAFFAGDPADVSPGIRQAL